MTSLQTQEVAAVPFYWWDGTYQNYFTQVCKLSHTKRKKAKILFCARSESNQSPLDFQFSPWHGSHHKQIHSKATRPECPMNPKDYWGDCVLKISIFMTLDSNAICPPSNTHSRACLWATLSSTWEGRKLTASAAFFQIGSWNSIFTPTPTPLVNGLLNFLLGHPIRVAGNPNTTGHTGILLVTLKGRKAIMFSCITVFSLQKI